MQTASEGTNQPVTHSRAIFRTAKKLLRCALSDCHTGSFRRLRVFSPKIFIDKLGEGSGDSHHPALPFDSNVPPFKLLDGVLLGRPLIKRPQISIDADVHDPA